MRNQPFRIYGAQNIVTGASAATLLTKGQCVLCTNTSSTPAEVIYVNFGRAGNTIAAGGGVAIMPGSSLLLSVEPDPSAPNVQVGMGATHILTVAAAGTPTLNVATGEGSGGAGV